MQCIMYFLFVWCSLNILILIISVSSTIPDGNTDSTDKVGKSEMDGQCDIEVTLKDGHADSSVKSTGQGDCF